MDNNVSDFSQLDFIDTSYDTPRTPDTVTSDIVTQRQDVSTSASTNDAWTGFLTKTLGTVLDYSIKKDAAVTSVQLQAQNKASPYYVGVRTAATTGGMVITPQFLMIGALVAFLVLKK